MDQSEVGLAKARRLAGARGVEIETVAADLADYSIAAGAWAGIVATFAHLPPALRRRVHRAVVAGLQPGGVFILEAYTPAQLAFGTGGPKSPELLMTLADSAGGIVRPRISDCPRAGTRRDRGRRPYRPGRRRANSRPAALKPSKLIVGNG